MLIIVHRALRLILVCGIVLAASSCAPFSVRAAAPAVGAAAPDFALPALDGRSVRLSSKRGQVVIVNFWASWCGPCVRETPRLVHWNQQYGSRGLVVLGVDSLYLDSRPSVDTFAKDNRVSYPILLDGDGSIAKQWRAQQLPRSYVIDRGGVVRLMRIGELTAGDLESEVLPLLSRN